MALPAALIRPLPQPPISSAGPIRNRQMLERSIDLAAALSLGAGLLVIAFPVMSRHRLPGGSGPPPQPAVRHPDRSDRDRGSGIAACDGALLAPEPRLSNRSPCIPHTHTAMSVAIPVTTSPETTPQLPTLWELGTDLQAETHWIARLSERLDTGDDDERALAIADLEESLALEDNKREPPSHGCTTATSRSETTSPRSGCVRPWRSTPSSRRNFLLA